MRYIKSCAIFAVMCLIYSRCLNRDGVGHIKSGINAFHWVPADSLAGFDMARIYTNWEWFNTSDGKFKFEPGYGGGMNLDKYLTSCKDKGIDPLLCIHNSPKWIVGESGDYEFAPVLPSEQMSDQNAYRYAGELFFQIAARYGRQQWPSTILKIDTTERWTNEGKNKVLSGLNLLKYIEVWNEPDKFWKKGTRAYFEPEQYAAMLSTCYDQIKRADPSMRVVMGGITELDTAYLGRMSTWFKSNRVDGRFAADVINVHHYLNADGGLFNGEEYGVSPSKDNTYSKFTAFVSYCKKISPNSPVWWTEFGYDSNPQSQLSAPIDSIGPWIIACFSEAQKAGVDAAFIFNSIDGLGPNEGLFNSSGLWTHPSTPGGMKPKPYVKFIKNNLKSI